MLLPFIFLQHNDHMLPQFMFLQYNDHMLPQFTFLQYNDHMLPQFTFLQHNALCLRGLRRNLEVPLFCYSSSKNWTWMSNSGTIEPGWLVGPFAYCCNTPAQNRQNFLVPEISSDDKVHVLRLAKYALPTSLNSGFVYDSPSLSVSV